MRGTTQREGSTGRSWSMVTRELMIVVLVLWAGTATACYCGSDSMGSTCKPTAKGASKCKSGICIAECGNGRPVNQCAGGLCTETPCRDGWVCTHIEGSEHPRCLPMGVCSGKADSAASQPLAIGVYSVDGLIPRKDQ